jgi:hypothetical protein
MADKNEKKPRIFTQTRRIPVYVPIYRGERSVESGIEEGHDVRKIELIAHDKSYRTSYFVYGKEGRDTAVITVTFRIRLPHFELIPLILSKERCLLWMKWDLKAGAFPDEEAPKLSIGAVLIIEPTEIHIFPFHNVGLVSCDEEFLQHLGAAAFHTEFMEQTQNIAVEFYKKWIDAEEISNREKKSVDSPWIDPKDREPFSAFMMRVVREFNFDGFENPLVAQGKKSTLEQRSRRTIWSHFSYWQKTVERQKSVFIQQVAPNAAQGSLFALQALKRDLQKKQPPEGG